MATRTCKKTMAVYVVQRVNWEYNDEYDERCEGAPLRTFLSREKAEAYARELAALPRDASGRPRFDLILLGLGEDGHTASLFPGDPALLEERAWVRAVRASKPPPDRLTLTLPVINASRAVLFLVQGAAKRSALQAVRRRDPRVPASLVQPVNGELRFIVDREALVEDPATV